MEDPSKTSLPFPVSFYGYMSFSMGCYIDTAVPKVPSYQHRMLEKWKTRAVAKEAELVARKKQRCEELKMCVQQMIEAKNLNHSTPKPQQVSTRPQFYVRYCIIEHKDY